MKRLIQTLCFVLLLASQSLAANLYVRSTDGNNIDNGSTWALAKATIKGALDIASAGDTIWVSQSHVGAIGGASVTYTCAGTAASPIRILCGNDGAEPPTALATTAAESNTGTNNMTFASGHAYIYGVAISQGTTGASMAFESTTSSGWVFDTCTIRPHTLMNVGTNGGNLDDASLTLINSTLDFGTGSGSGMALMGMPFTMRGGTFTGTGVPASLVTPGNFGDWCTARFYGVDLSSIGSGKALVNVSATKWGEVLFQDCKLGASVALTTGTHPGTGGITVRMVNCDSGDTNYRYQKTNYQGTITQETTIVRTSGASDGTTSVSRKMVSSANAKYWSPLESDPISYWNETTGSSVTVTIPVITDNVTLTDAEAWVEVEYLGTSGFPIASTISDRSTDILASAANQTTDGSSMWTTTGLTTPVKQSLAVTFTPQEKGLIRARVMLAKASTTMYYDPKILTGSARQYMAGGALGVGNEGVSSGGGVSRARVVNPRD